MKKFMKKFEIKKNYDKKIKEYLSHNRSYYEKRTKDICWDIFMSNS